MIRKRPLTCTILLVFLFYVLCGMFFCFSYESNDDPAFENMLRGVYWNTPVTNFYFYYRGIAYVFIWLYQNLDFGINWYGYSLILGSAVSCFIMFYIVYFKTKDIYIALFFLAVFLQNVFLVSFTRVSILLSFTGAFLFAIASEFKRKKQILLLASFIFTWAFLMRPSSGILSLLLSLPFIVTWYDFEKMKIKKLVLPVIPLIAGLLIVHFVNNFQDREFTQNIKAASKYTFPVLDYNIEVQMSTEKDRQIYYELQNWFFFNKEIIDVKYIKNLVDFEKAGIPDFKIIWQKTSNLGSKIIYKPFLFISLLLLIVFFLKENLFSIRQIFILFYFAGALVAINTLMKMPYRVLIPCLTIIIFYLLLYNDWLNLAKPLQIKLIKYSGLVVLSVVFIFQLYLYHKKANKTDIESTNKFYTLIKEIGDKNVILLKNPEFNYKPLRYIELDTNNTLIPAFGWTAHNKIGYDYFKDICGSDNIKNIFSCIDQHDDFLFLSDSNKNNILLNILEMHDIQGTMKFVNYNKEYSDFQLYKFSKE